MYEYGRTPRKNNPRTWTPYIAKVARKWYPDESITEYLLNRLGYALGVTAANSRLVIDEEFGRLRFLSEYFLRPVDNLEHGAEIFADYLSADTKLVDEIEKDRKTVRNFFTFQFAEGAILHRFGYGEEAKKLICDLVRMICPYVCCSTEKMKSLLVQNRTCCCCCCPTVWKGPGATFAGV